MASPCVLTRVHPYIHSTEAGEEKGEEKEEEGGEGQKSGL